MRRRERRPGTGMKIDPRRPQSKLNRSRACSSPDRAFGSGPKGSRFDSCQAHFCTGRCHRIHDRAWAADWGVEMRAAVCTAYGPPEVLQIRTVPDPRPRDKEVCIRLVATSVTASDCIVRGLKLRGVYRLFMRAAFGFRAPRKGIIGMIAAGEIESVGREVTSFKPGDQVFGMDGFRAGTYAEKVCWPASAALALRPANLTYEESASLPYGGLLASFFVRRLKVRKGQQVLIYGASGAIGTSAVQLARHLGAEV